MNFTQWIKDTHPEYFEEGWKDWAGKMGVGGALAAGALHGYNNLHGSLNNIGNPISHSAPANNLSPKLANSLGRQNNSFDFKLGGPHKVHSHIKINSFGEDSQGSIEVKFLSFGDMTNRNTELNQEKAHEFAKQCLQANDLKHSYLWPNGYQQDGPWFVAVYDFGNQ